MTTRWPKVRGGRWPKVKEDDMRKRLFVDCYDTLIVYIDGDDEPHPNGVIQGQMYRINEPLAASVKAYVEDNPCSLVVVWSGGGAQYARTIADIVLPGVDVMTMIKDETSFHMVRAGDIVIDDMNLRVPAKVLRPNEWVYPT